ncbi:MAG: LuxR C-terminal-related transcriptional regulator [Candidatus Hodarchaeales archaeon]|jgi:hypothetical protein
MSNSVKSILSEVETHVFTSMNAGLSNDEIADKLNMTNSYVRKTKTKIRKKITKELTQVANTLRLQFSNSDIEREVGVLKCFDWVNNTYVILIFTPEHGILAYYDHECSSNCIETCTETLNLIRSSRQILVPDRVNSLPIRLQYEHVFESIRKQGDSK